MRRQLSFGTLGMLVVLSACASGTADLTASATPSLVTGLSATASPTKSSSPSVAALVVDGLASSTVDGLTVRSKPSTAGAALGTIAQGQRGFVVAGPVNANGYVWYQLSGLGLPVPAGCEQIRTNPFNCPDWLGWVAAGAPGGPTWLVATTPPCPASPMNLETLVLGGQTDLQRLACYGSTPIRFRGWWPQIPSDAGLGGTCGAPKPNPTWLVCQGLNYNGLVISKSAGFEGVGLRVSIDPASGVTMPPRGQWVEEVAHLDDRAARDCVPWAGGDQDAVRIVLTCRGQLVVESVRPVSGPY